MDLEATVSLLFSENEQLKQENDELRMMMSIVKENRELTAKTVQSYSNNDQDDSSVCTPWAVRKAPSQFQHTVDEGIFRNNLQQTSAKREHRTSSPVNFTTFIQRSMCPDTSKIQGIQAETSSVFKGAEKILGEIVFQLDKRIVSHVFEGRGRIYGFTVHNIPEKIIDVSKHPLYGEVDEGYRRYLTQRYNVLMESLAQLGYKTRLHPNFTESIINSYGLLHRRDLRLPELNNSDYLRQLVTTTAPPNLQKDLLILLNCLCNMAENDKRPICLV